MGKEENIQGVIRGIILMQTGLYIYNYSPPSEDEIRRMGPAELLKEFEEYASCVGKVTDLNPDGLDKIKERLGMLRTEMFNRLTAYEDEF